MEDLVFESIVKIYGSDNQLKGMGFVIKQDDQFSSVLTCNHVVYRGEKKDIKVDNIAVSKNNITYGHELGDQALDLAIIKVSNAINKSVISLQRGLDKSATLHVKTLSQSDDALFFDNTFIELNYIQQDLLHYCNINASAYLFQTTNQNSDIVKGYSGSPIIDIKTGKVIAILNMIRGEETDECKGLLMSNVIKIFPEISDDLELVKNIKSKASVIFRSSNRPDSYDVIIDNDDETFENMDITDDVKQKEFVDYLMNLPKVHNRSIEFFVPPELFTKNIHLWESSRKKSLIQKYSVYFRSLNLSETSGDLKEYWETKWEEDYIDCKNTPFKNSVTFIDGDKCFHPDIVSAVADQDVEFTEDDFIELEDDCISIVVWKNTCEDTSKYNSFVTEIQKQDFNDGFTQSFKQEIFKRKRCCSTHTCLMWDNPYDLPTAKDQKDAK